MRASSAHYFDCVRRHIYTIVVIYIIINYKLNFLNCLFRYCRSVNERDFSEYPPSSNAILKWFRDLRFSYRSRGYTEQDAEENNGISRTNPLYRSEGRKQQRKNTDRRRYSFNGRLSATQPPPHDKRR